MSDNKKPEQRPPESYTPASPVKRTLAWIALAYVLIGLALTTFYFFNGYMLGNLGPLLTVPGLVGLIVLLVCWGLVAADFVVSLAKRLNYLFYVVAGVIGVVGCRTVDMQFAEISTVVTSLAENVADTFGVLTQRTDGAVRMTVQWHSALIGVHTCQQNAPMGTT